MKYLKTIFKPNYLDGVICYGLGSISKFAISREQCALLLMIQKEFQCKVEIFDPCFNETDKLIFSQWQMNILDVNENCKRVCDDQNLLFFMVHCLNEHYENLLSVNWKRNNLGRLSIIGNSFKTTSDNYTRIGTKKEFLRDFKHINAAATFCSEFKLPIMIETNTFSDSALIYFNESKLKDIELKIF